MIEILKNSVLFKNIDENEIEILISCIMPRMACYDENSIIFNHGDKIKEIGFILSGAVQVVREDFWGNRSIISHLNEGDFFGEVYAAVGERKIENTVYAAQKSEILFISKEKLTGTCCENCSFHQKVVNNFIKVLAEKNIMLMEKITHISQKNTRQKVLSFLSSMAEKSGNIYFYIPFSRQEMADYLSVDRSALSKELGKMREEKIIDFDKNRFRIL